ncbi:hypothetical protein L3Q82_017985 [Scortum barcoo]|uniref:Uncharacterized protein n=1 Tax=Scortum barcoo TaxID=214431 RepID=A0ACB8VI70_9TELE|nr:hypothetical protein L3Q82_017985 [Scortum barcoo]
MIPNTPPGQRKEWLRKKHFKVLEWPSQFSRSQPHRKSLEGVESLCCPATAPKHHCSRGDLHVEEWAKIPATRDRGQWKGDATDDESSGTAAWHVEMLSAAAAESAAAARAVVTFSTVSTADNVAELPKTDYNRGVTHRDIQWENGINDKDNKWQEETSTSDVFSEYGRSTRLPAAKDDAQSPLSSSVKVGGLSSCFHLSLPPPSTPTFFVSL